MECPSRLCYLWTVIGILQPQLVGSLLRDWRKRRRLSQLDLASDADISTRHPSFIETGRSQPSREMVLHLAEQLEVPLSELALESFFPADAATAENLRRIAESHPQE